MGIQTNLALIDLKDSEMQLAVKELNEAHKAFETASNRYRVDEAAYRIKAASERINAIVYERSSKYDKELVTEVVGAGKEEQAI